MDHSCTVAWTFRAPRRKRRRVALHGSGDRKRDWARVHGLSLWNHRLWRKSPLLSTQPSIIWSWSIHCSIWLGRILRSVYFHSLAKDGAVRLGLASLPYLFYIDPNPTKPKPRAQRRFKSGQLGPSRRPYNRHFRRHSNK